MVFKEPAFTIGIEEEYLLVDPQTGDLAPDPPTELLTACQAEVSGQVAPEFLRSQVEVDTKVCTSIAEVGHELRALRSGVGRVVRAHGYDIIAASTHPSADWGLQIQTEKERYNVLARDLQAVARRLAICAMHVHVGIEDVELRIELMNQARYFLPHLLALSTSSPFWRGLNTGLKSYRIAVWGELPRTGLPPRFSSYGEYRHLVSTLVQSGVIEDATKLWWDIRPSDRFPTLEMRMTDVCTRVDDAICIAALYLCILRMLWRLRLANQHWRIYDNVLVSENRWRAQRYGYDEGLIDFSRGEIVAYADLFEELLVLIADDIEALDCRAEVEHGREILARGTSAHRQLAVWEAAKAANLDDAQALREVVKMLIEETNLDGPAASLSNR